MAPGYRALAALVGALALAALLGESTLVLQRISADDAYTMFPIPVASAAVRANARLEDAVVTWLNQERAARGLPLLHANTMMRDVARAYGRDMFLHGYLSHVSRRGRTLQERLAGTGLHFRIIGENLAYAADVREAEQALWQSPPHQRNILYPAFQLVGVGVIDGGDGVIIVQDFADDPSPDPTARRLPPGHLAR